MLPKQLLKKYWRRANRYIPVLISTLIFLLIFIFIDQFFLIKKVEIFGLSRNKTLLGLDNYTRRSLLFISPEKEAKRIVENNPDVKSAQVKKGFPTTLIISINLYRPFAFLKVKEGFFILSEDGRILVKKKEKDRSLPTINYYQLLNYQFFHSGDRVSYNDILTGLHFLKSVSDLGLKVLTIDITGINMIGFNLMDKNGQDTQRKIFFSAEKSLDRQDYELRAIVKQFVIEGRDFKSLDLRFDKPVVKFR